jgi:hypothetical protein
MIRTGAKQFRNGSQRLGISTAVSRTNSEGLRMGTEAFGTGAKPGAWH